MYSSWNRRNGLPEIRKPRLLCGHLVVLLTDLVDGRYPGSSHFTCQKNQSLLSASGHAIAVRLCRFSSCSQNLSADTRSSRAIPDIKTYRWYVGRSAEDKFPSHGASYLSRFGQLPQRSRALEARKAVTSTKESRNRLRGRMINRLVRKIRQDLMAIRITYLDIEQAGWNPTFIQIEATSKCNLRCPGCSHSREAESGQHLSLDQLQEILDILPFPPKHVILSGVGEPLLNPHFFSLVDLLAERGTSCHFFTNGTLLSPKACEAIVRRQNIISLTISGDGAEETTFENLRLGAHFESWKRSVRGLTERAKDERPELRIGMNTVISRQNINELGDIIRLAADLGFRVVHFLDPIPVDEITAANVPSEIEFTAIDFKELSGLGRSLGLAVSWQIRRGARSSAVIQRCLHPWKTIFIRANGNVQPCMALFGTEKAAVMGNIFQEDFQDIWNGERYREYRRAKKRGTNSLCRVCPYR